MNQTEATQVITEYLEPEVDSVTIGRAVEGNHPDVLLVNLTHSGPVLSVTVEILAQP